VLRAYLRRTGGDQPRRDVWGLSRAAEPSMRQRAWRESRCLDPCGDTWA